MNKRLALVGLLLVLTTTLVTAANRMYPVYPVTGPIVVDGKIDEPAWEGAPVGGDLLPLAGSGPAQGTTFRVLYDSDALYIGLRAEESRIARVRVAHEDGGYIWEDDSIEVFLRPGDKDRPYYQFAINAVGKRCAAGIGGTAPPLDAWRAAASQGPDYYVMEIKIPFSAFRVTPASAGPLRGNICRNCYTGGDAGPHNSWAPLQVNFHEPRNFAEFQFQATPVSPDRSAAVSRFVNMAYDDRTERGARRRLRACEELLDLAKYEPEMDTKATEIVQSWRIGREDADRFCRYKDHFSTARIKAGFWEREHPILSAGVTDSAAAFRSELRLDNEAEKLRYHLLLKKLLR